MKFSGIKKLVPRNTKQKELLSAVAAKAEEAQRFLEQPAPAPAPVATNAPAPAALRPPPIRIAPRLEDAGAGGEETLFDRDLWRRTGDESPTPESSARVRFE